MHMTAVLLHGSLFVKLALQLLHVLYVKVCLPGNGILMHHIVRSAWITICNAERQQAMSVQHLQTVSMQSLPDMALVT